MECEGFKVDIDKLAELSRQYEQATIDLQEAIYALAGHEFNIASTKQLGTVLFEELGLLREAFPESLRRTGTAGDKKDEARLFHGYRGLGASGE